MKKNRIGMSIVIPDNLSGTNCADLSTLIELTSNDENILVVGTLKVTETDGARPRKLDGMFAKGLIHGFKIFPGHDPIYPTDKRWRNVFKLCVRHNKPLIVHTGINPDNEKAAVYNDPKYIVKVADEHPKLKIIISHYFWPKLDYCFSITQGYKNIFFDTSGLADTDVIRRSGGIKAVREILEKTANRRKDSVLFGTDWPLCNVEKHIALINSLKVSGAGKKRIFYVNAFEAFRLNKEY